VVVSYDLLNIRRHGPWIFTALVLMVYLIFAMYTWRLRKATNLDAIVERQWPPSA